MKNLQTLTMGFLLATGAITIGNKVNAQDHKHKEENLTKDNANSWVVPQSHSSYNHLMPAKYEIGPQAILPDLLNSLTDVNGSFKPDARKTALEYVKSLELISKPDTVESDGKLQERTTYMLNGVFFQSYVNIEKDGKRTPEYLILTSAEDERKGFDNQHIFDFVNGLKEFRKFEKKHAKFDDNMEALSEDRLAQLRFHKATILLGETLIEELGNKPPSGPKLK